MFQEEPNFEDLSQADILRLQRLQQGKASVLERMDNGELSPDEGSALLSQVNGMLVPLMQRKVQGVNFRKNAMRQSMLDDVANQQAVEQMNAQYRAQNIEKRVAVVNDPVTGRTAHYFEQKPNDWAPVEWPEMPIDENAPDWQPLDPSQDHYERPGIPPHLQGQPQYFPFNMGPGQWQAPPVNLGPIESAIGIPLSQQYAPPPQPTQSELTGPPTPDQAIEQYVEGARAAAQRVGISFTPAREEEARAIARQRLGIESAPGQAAIAPARPAVPEAQAQQQLRQQLGLPPSQVPSAQPATRRVVDYRPGENYGQVVEEPVPSREAQLRQDWGGTPPPAMTREQYDAYRARTSGTSVPGAVTVPNHSDLMREWIDRPVSNRVASEMDSWNRRNPRATQAQRAHMESVIYAGQQQSYHAAEVAARQAINIAQNHNRQAALEASRQTNRQTMANLRGLRYNQNIVSPTQVGQIRQRVRQDMAKENTAPSGQEARASWQAPEWGRGGRSSRDWAEEEHYRFLENLNDIPGALDAQGAREFQRLRDNRYRREDMAAGRQDPFPQNAMHGEVQPYTQQRVQTITSSFDRALQHPNISGSATWTNMVRDMQSTLRRYGSVDRMPPDVATNYRNRERQLQSRLSQGG